MIYDKDYFSTLSSKSVGDLEGKYNQFVKFAERFLNVVPTSILDYGCGTGQLCKFLKVRFPNARVVGLEKHSEALVYVQSTTESHGIQFLTVDLEKDEFVNPLGNMKFDLVVSHEVIEHLENSRRVLTQFHSLLREGGVVLLKSPNGFDIKRFICFLIGKKWYADYDETHIRYYNAFTIRKLLLDVGFKKVFVYTGTKKILNYSLLKIGYPPILGHGLIAVGVK